MKPFSLLLISILFVGFAEAQDVNYARKVITELTSPEYGGRGYYQHGARKAARYIVSEFERAGLEAPGGSYLQPFQIDINCIVGKTLLEIEGQKLQAGTEYLISRNSPAIKGTFEILVLNEEPESLQSLLKRTATLALEDKFVVTANTDREITEENVFHAAGVIQITDDKLWWHVSNGHKVIDVPVIKVSRAALDISANTLKVNIKNMFLQDYITENVVGVVEGKKDPDKVVLITAHYDHLGYMGKDVYFPGAHDNASGVSMIMDLARYFSENPPNVTVVFIAFGAEETGLEGSAYYCKHPAFDLKHTLFSMNLDMIGSGSTGVKVVNGSVLTSYFQLLTQINDENYYVAKVASRGEAANSDHYHLYDHGVPAFFIYTTGDEYKEYHTVTDQAEGLPLTAYDGLFQLVRDFVIAFPK